MLRFILAVMIIAVLLKITQDNAYIGFGLYLIMYASFMLYTMNTLDCEEGDFPNPRDQSATINNDKYRKN